MSKVEHTSLYDIAEFDEQEVHEILNEVYTSLTDRGYNATNQIVGYLISGDPGYISSYNDSRNKIQQIDRAKIIIIFSKE